MKSRSGQVALYLVLVLVALTLLVLMNVGTYLAVTAKNRAMNAGDAAALAVARHQGELLNRIGQLNLDHLRATLERSLEPGLSAADAEQRLAEGRERCRTLSEDQRRLCFLGPLDGLRIANDWAARNGITEPDEEALDILRQHVIDIRTGYAMDVEQYPEPWEGAWTEYAFALETAISGGILAAPDNLDFIDAAGGHLLLDARFYNAVAGRNWCWFRFHAPGAFDAYSGVSSWDPLPTADDDTRLRRCGNSEVFSLHLTPRVGSALMLFGREEIRALTGCSDEEIAESALVRDAEQVWYFYDTSEDGLWRTWWEIDPDGNAQNEGFGMPVVGRVKAAYDVRGCAATCRVMRRIPAVSPGHDAGVTHWTGAAKPFGTVEDVRGEAQPVTARNGLVLPSFSSVRLVPWDSVGGNDTTRPNLDMVAHVRNHLSLYLANGVTALVPGCFYCEQLREWEREELREQAKNWLRQNADTCRRTTNGGSGRGGTSHAH